MDLPVSSNWRKNNLTRELMREDLQIELEALKVSHMEPIKVSPEQVLEVLLDQLNQELMLEDLLMELSRPWR